MHREFSVDVRRPGRYVLVLQASAFLESLRERKRRIRRWLIEIRSPCQEGRAGRSQIQTVQV